jgi:hypothetical protein
VNWLGFCQPFLPTGDVDAHVGSPACSLGYLARPRIRVLALTEGLEPLQTGSLRQCSTSSGSEIQECLRSS